VKRWKFAVTPGNLALNALTVFCAVVGSSAVYQVTDPSFFAAAYSFATAALEAEAVLDADEVAAGVELEHAARPRAAIETTAGMTTSLRNLRSGAVDLVDNIVGAFFPWTSLFRSEAQSIGRAVAGNRSIS
jgi:hypothetical protein